MRTAIPAAAAVLLLAACAGAPRGAGVPAGPETAPGGGAAGVPDPAAPVPLVAGQRQWTGSRSAAFTDMFVTARDRRGWALLWQLAGEDPPGPLPEDAIGVGVFLGMRPTAGYGVEVVDVRYWPQEVLVVYEEIPPPSDAATGQAITAPYAIAVAPTSEARVHFRSVQ
jgi:hypothetical protein